MKYSLILILCLLSSAVSLANSIDSLKTDGEVERFVNKVYKTVYTKSNEELIVLSTDSLLKKLACNGIARKWNIKNWEKVDFDKDGRTDLLVTVTYQNHRFDVFAIMDKGNTFALLRLSKNIFENCELAKPAFVNNKQVLLFYSIKRDQDLLSMPQIDTLVFKYGNFVELNTKPTGYKIKSINFTTSGCYGSCPIFELNIQENGRATYYAKSYNPKPGFFKVVISAEKLNEIFALINYLAIKGLKDNYEVNWTDDQTSHLTLKFDDGTTKEIRDYGMQGTFGLYQLYSVLSALRLDQYWINDNPIKSPQHVGGFDALKN
jgi:hypothetical protein